jgi:predicted MFS family arabinose efflux permease
LGYVLIGPPIGTLADRLGLETTLLVCAALFGAATLTCLAAFRRAHACDSSD